MQSGERPLSPHAGIYRWQVTNSLSILHRVTGIALSLGLLVFVCWLIALASGAETYAGVHAFYSGAWFKLPLVAWCFCFFFHLANGVRHLFWDVGLGFSHTQIRASGWTVVIAALAATAIFSLIVIL
jgi:succinate dehydrogenase cytochrome b subunit